MASDMDFLRSDTIRRLLDSLGIQAVDMLGVVFDPLVETGASSSQQVTSLSQQLSQMASMDYNGGDVGNQSPGVAANPSPGNVPAENAAGGEPLRKGGLEGSAVFGDEGTGAGRGMSDLDAAITVVLEEETLQRALLLEKKALLSRGAFIPLMKFDLENYSTVDESKQASTRNSRK
jgi:hypothetical protein